MISYISEHLGSSHLITDSLGKVVREESRFPYGLERRTQGEATTDYVYTGKELDEETGLIYFGGRNYAPTLGRWITPDPSYADKPVQVVGKPLEQNLYEYSRGNPISYVDPTGFGSMARTGGDYDVFAGAPESSYQYGGYLLDVAPLACNMAANALGYATEAIDTVLGYAGMNLEEVSVTTMMLPGLGSAMGMAAKYGAAWVNSARYSRAVGLISSETGMASIGAAGRRSLVIGENMTERVVPYARNIGADYYKGMPGFKPGMEAEGLLHNQLYIEQKMAEGYKIIDIGPDFMKRAHTGMPSQNYNMERMITKGYEGYEKAFTRNGGSSVVDY